jgi:hypothetical protein
MAKKTPRTTTRKNRCRGCGGDISDMPGAAHSSSQCAEADRLCN